MTAFLVALLPATALAQDIVRDTFTHIRECVLKNDSPACRPWLTQASLPMYDRFVSYGLMRCLPRTATFISQKPQGKMTLVRAAVTTSSGEDRIMRLLFTRENNTWKLDLPETLKGGLGPKWEQQVAFAETAYLIVRQQMGVDLNCDTINNLSPKPETARTSKE